MIEGDGRDHHRRCRRRQVPLTSFSACPPAPPTDRAPRSFSHTQHNKHKHKYTHAHTHTHTPPNAMPTPLQQQRQGASSSAAVAVRRSLEDWLPRGSKAVASPCASPTRRGRAPRDENARPEQQVSGGERRGGERHGAAPPERMRQVFASVGALARPLCARTPAMRPTTSPLTHLVTLPTPSISRLRRMGPFSRCV